MLDAQLSRAIATLLQERGLDAQAATARADIPDSAPDAAIMEFAATEGRAVVTKNIKDFRPIAARRLQLDQGHAGLILIPSTVRRNRAANAALADQLATLMRESPEGLAGAECWLSR